MKKLLLLMKKKNKLSFSSGEVGTVDASTVVVVFSRQVAATNAKTGVTITVDGGGATISTGTIQANKRIVYYALDTPVTAGQVVTWAYNGATGNITDYVTSAALATVAAKPVTNNVVSGYSPSLDFSDARNSMYWAVEMV
jgi:hypothetical protein